MDKYSPAGKFGLFPVFAITNKADMNICAQVFMWTIFSFSWVKCLGMEWLDYMIGICLTFKETIKLIPKVVLLFYVLSSVLEFQFLHINA